MICEPKDVAELMSTIELDITERCNGGCVSCSRACSVLPSDEGMRWEDVHRFIKQSVALGKKWRRIGILGGEPTMCPDLNGILDDLGCYKKGHPDCKIDMITNGGEAFKKWESRLPDWLEIRNHARTKTRPNQGHHAFYIAPWDVGEWDGGEQGCEAVPHCGIGLTRHGYFPCVLGGTINRVFDLGLGIPELADATFENLSEMYEKLCPLCGWYLVKSGKIHDYAPMDMSQSWADALEERNACGEIDSNPGIRAMRELSWRELKKWSVVEGIIADCGVRCKRPPEFPRWLVERGNRGLMMEQMPCQFAEYLIALSGRNIRTYLEVGAFLGGSFIATVEYLRRFYGLKRAVAVDIHKAPPRLRKYIRGSEVCDYAKMDTASEEFKALAASEEWDLALIDAEHTHEASLRDFENVRKHAKAIAFHDIVHHHSKGQVAKTWKMVKALGEYDCREFTGQYPGMPKRLCGIGLAVKK